MLGQKRLKLAHLLLKHRVQHVLLVHRLLSKLFLKGVLELLQLTVMIGQRCFKMRAL